MGFRFQKRLKILPGVTLNISKSGVSTSVGVKGARATFGKGKPRTTVGIPGSGLSHTKVHTTSATTPSNAPNQGRSGIGKLLLWSIAGTFILLLLFSAFIRS